MKTTAKYFKKTKTKKKPEKDHGNTTESVDIEKKRLGFKIEKVKAF